MDQKPKISRAPQIYGTKPVSDNLKTFWERCGEKFKPEDFVRVMNIDDETFYWQALDPRDEIHNIEGNQFMVHDNTIRRDPKIWSIPAGATMVLEGWNAAIMIEKLYKKMLAKKSTSQPLAEGQKVRNFGFANPDRQEEYIGKIFVNVERPTFGPSADHTITSPMTEAQASQIKADPSVAELAKELGLDGAVNTTA